MRSSFSIGGRTFAIARGLIGFGLLALLFFLIRGLVGSWAELRSEEIEFRPALLLLSIVPGLGAIWVSALAWIKIVEGLAGPNSPGTSQLSRVFLYSWIGRYIPGKVAYALGRFYLGRTVGVSSGVLVASMAYETVLLAVAAFAFASITIIPSLAVVSESVLPYLVLPIVAIGGASVLHPRVMRWALRLAVRLLGRETPGDEWLLPPRRMVEVAALFFAAFSLAGVGLYLVIISVTSYSPGYLPLLAGAYTLAGIAGMLSLFAPAGLGVREGFLVALLQFTMPLELAILIALITRAWATVLDLLALAGCFVYDYRSKERLLFAALSGRRNAERAGDSSAKVEL